MYKFLGYMRKAHVLHDRTVKKFEKLAESTLREHPPQMNVERYMVTVDPNYIYYNESYRLIIYYYENFEKCRIIFLGNNTKEKEIEMYLKRIDP